MNNDIKDYDEWQRENNTELMQDFCDMVDDQFQDYCRAIFEAEK